MDLAKPVVLATSLWIVAGIAVAAPLSVTMESGSDAGLATAASVDAEPLEFENQAHWNEVDAFTSSAAFEPQFQRLLPGIAVPPLRQHDTQLPATGLRWSMSGARPTLEFRLAPNQVLRLRGQRRGALLTLRWDF